MRKELDFLLIEFCKVAVLLLLLLCHCIWLKIIFCFWLQLAGVEIHAIW